MKSLFAILGLAVTLLFYSCGSDVNSGDNKGQNTNILSVDPYKPLSDSINADNKNTELYIRRASLLTRNAEHELAYADLQRAWELSPVEEIAEMKVSSLFMAGRNDKALELLKELTVRFPENTNLKRRLGEALLQNGQYDKALEAYDKMLAEDSLDFEAWFEKAMLYLEKKDTPSALRHLETSFRIQPLQMTALSLANLYAEARDPRSLEMADLVIGRDSVGEMPDPYFIKGIYFANTGNTAKALDQFNQVIKIDWKFQEAYIEKGIIYFDQKNLDEALKQFKLAATVSNTYADAYYWQGRCYEKLGKKEEALSNYAKAYSLDRNFTEAVEAAARVKGEK